MLSLIRKTIAPAQLKPQYADVILSRMDMYEIAFTHKSCDPTNNYEMFEMIGDATANKFVVWYFYRRFPQLNCSKGVKVLARLKINYSSKVMFAKIADSLGFWPYIRTCDPNKNLAKKSLLEDVFEAFVGLTEMLLDEYFTIGVGYAVVHDILKAIFDEFDVSIVYEELKDAKTKLKELFDKNAKRIGTHAYEEGPNNATRVYAYSPSGEKVLMGEGFGYVKADRQQEAAVMALKYLEQKGVVQPANYDLICE